MTGDQQKGQQQYGKPCNWGSEVNHAIRIQKSTRQSGFRSQPCNRGSEVSQRRRIQSLLPQASTFESVNLPFPKLFVIGDVNIALLFTLF